MMTSAAATTDQVLLRESGKKGFLTLCRPKALNALNLNMINLIYPKLKAWESDLSFVVMTGEGDKAFCAGGDIRAVTEAGKKGDPTAKDFFKAEYLLNYLIGSYKIPFVAVIHGITMGGGVGLSVHGKYRVATDKTVFAMPETGIGLFPDVGGSYFLPRLQGQLGMYLALTGFRLTGVDVLRAGIATHFCSSNKLKDLRKDLENLQDASLLSKVLGDYTEKSLVGMPQDFVLKPVLSKIDEIFGVDSIENVIKMLDKDNSDWAMKQKATLSKMSPSSLKVTFQLQRKGAKLNFKQCLEMEYIAVQHFMKNADFYEGVRAVLIDRDNSPKWTPSRLENVMKVQVDSYFDPKPPTELLVL